MNLRINDSVLLLTGEGAYYSFDIETKTLTRLNETAALILGLANGNLTESEILRSVLPLIGPDKLDKCRKWIAKAILKGLITEQDTNTPARNYDAKEIADISANLLDQDEVRIAFLLQKRAAELAPADPFQWYKLGELAHITGDRALARSAYETYLESQPNDAEIIHLLKALRNEPTPQRAPNECILKIYDRFAAFYEQTMTADLLYQAPNHLLKAIRDALPHTSDLFALELGCGTGLFGTRIRPICQRLVGVDISQAMLEKSAIRNVYDELYCAEITAWLDQEPTHLFDLIAICDTLIYFGDLRQVLHACLKHLKPEGLLAFTLEKSNVAPFQLGDSGRFRHHRNHVRDVASESGLLFAHRSEKVLRREYGDNVIGLVTVLRNKQTT